MNIRVFLRGVALIASFAVIGYVLKVSGFGAMFDSGWIDADIRGQGATGALLFVAIGAGGTALGLPRQVISFLGGYAFGLVGGTALALLATVLGCTFSFSYARFFGRAFVAKRFPGRVRRIDEFLSENPFSMALLIRLLPAGNNLVTSLAAGVSGVSAIAFFAGSALGYIPQTVVFALVGSGIELDPAWRIGLSIVLFVVSGALGIYLYRKYRHGKMLGDDVEREIGTEPPTPRA